MISAIGSIFFCKIKIYFSRLISLEPHWIVISYDPDPTIPGALFGESHTFWQILKLKVKYTDSLTDLLTTDRKTKAYRPLFENKNRFGDYSLFLPLSKRRVWKSLHEIFVKKEGQTIKCEQYITKASLGSLCGCFLSEESKNFKQTAEAPFQTY